MAALSAGRYAPRCTIDQPPHDLLRRAQALPGHTVPAGDMGQVLNRSLALPVARLEKRRFGRTGRPRPCARRSGDAGPRAIPAAIRRQVHERDDGRCTFAGDSGHGCESRTALEHDHVVPLARRGETTPADRRLRRRAHDQHEADPAYGLEFIRHRRDGARRARDAAQARADERVPVLRHLGLSLADARLAAARATDLPPGSTLERRLRHVLRTLAPRGTEPVSFALTAAATHDDG